MKVAVVGEGHLGHATRVGCAAHHELVEAERADVVWFCVNTPVAANDKPLVSSVLDLLGRTLRETEPGTPVLISSQVPVGFCAQVESDYPQHHLAIQPENIRIKHAVDDFRYQARIIVGTRHDGDRPLLEQTLYPFLSFAGKIAFMSPESAEMVKHTLNTFLAMEIAFANEIADLCQQVGADVEDVSAGFRSDRRVGEGPLKPGGPFNGGTLGRDLYVLRALGAGPLIQGVHESNTARL